MVGATEGDSLVESRGFDKTVCFLCFQLGPKRCVVDFDFGKPSVECVSA